MSPTKHALLLSALAALPLAASIAAARATASPASTRSRTPTVSVTADGSRLAISGPTRWRPGAVRIDAVSPHGEQEFALLRFRHGYTYARFLADGARAGGRGAAAAAAMRRVFADTDFLGGANVFPGASAGFTVTVRPGTYYLGEMTGRPSFRKITVAGAPSAPAPRTATTVTAYDFGFHTNAATLPAHGTITIRNTGRQIHRLLFVPVRAGTSRAQIGAYLRTTGGRPYGPPPSFARPGPQVGTGMISPGEEIRFSYSLPAGRYAVLCFQPDSRTGKPQALEGMYGVATLR